MRNGLFSFATVLFVCALAISAGVSAGEVHDKAQAGDLDGVRSLIDGDPALLESKDAAGSTPLIAACAGGQFEVVKYLIGKGADLNAGDNEDSKAIHLAAVSGSIEIIEYLLSKGVDVDVRDENGMTALLFAGYRGRTEAVEYLLSRGADVGAMTSGGGTLVHAACYSGNLSLLEMLLEKGARADLPPDNYGNTPISAAAVRCRLDVLAKLIEKGAPLEPAYEGALSPMEAASFSGCNEAIEMLIAAGGDVDVLDNGGGTPLGSAAIRGYVETVRLLADLGADVNHRDDRGWRPLHYAAHSGKPEISEILLSKGADVNVANEEGLTPLIMAARQGDEASVGVFLSASADADTRDRRLGWTALHYSAVCGYSDISERLIAAGADVNVKDNAGATPLYYASKYGNNSAADCLERHDCKAVKCEKNFGYAKQLTSDLKAGEAFVWYLGHSGWAVRTKDNLLLFDCWESGRHPDDPCLSNGYVLPEEIAGQKVTVFVSHAHGDHYSKHILDWRDKVEGIDYVVGFPCDDLENYILAGPRAKIEHEGMSISTIESNDSGVGFLVEVDGVRIFHAGDHANRMRDFSGPFCAEIDYIRDGFDRIDLAFLPVTGCGFGDQEAVRLGVHYALDNLRPVVFFPMHGGKHSAQYADYSADVEEKGYGTKTAVPMSPGERFHFVRMSDGTPVLSTQGGEGR